MGIIAWIILGLIAGWGAKEFLPGYFHGGLFLQMLLGMAGAIVGGFLAGLLGLHSGNFLGKLFIAFIGAIIILFVYNKFIH